MSETNWASEPWYAIGPLTEEESGQAGGTPAEVGIACEDGPVVIGEFFNERDQDRAVACVNACTGIPDPAAEIERLRRVEVAAREVSDILFRASLSSNWNTHGVAILDAHAKLATALKEPANG